MTLSIILIIDHRTCAHCHIEYIAPNPQLLQRQRDHTRRTATYILHPCEFSAATPREVIHIHSSIAYCSECFTTTTSEENDDFARALAASAREHTPPLTALPRQNPYGLGFF